ncbi:MAG: hypothetical protein KDA32_01290 [Phycisphaerales bacterium]|nr:hypothetical protein [Phycisphaerales bacterium]
MQRVVGALVTIAIVGGLAYFRFQANEATDQKIDDTLSIVVEHVQQLPSYSQNSAFFDLHLESAHSAAFNSAYSSGGRRSPARFDAAKYAKVFCEHLSKRAQEKGDQKLDVEIRDMQIKLEQALDS